MTAHAIDTVEDLIRVLDANPVWLEALRARLLTRELLELPQKFAEFAAATERRFDGIDRRFDGIDQRFEGVDCRFEGVDCRFEGVDQRFEAVDRRFEQLLIDIAPIKAAHARHAALREADLIAEENGLTFIRLIDGMQLAELARSDAAAGIATNELRSFRRADLIAECRDDSGETCYLAAEISFTVNGRDTTRAIRNAALLTQVTGRPARAVVAGLRYDERIRGRLQAGEVAWYQLDPHALEVE